MNRLPAGRIRGLGFKSLAAHQAVQPFGSMKAGDEGSTIGARLAA
jgi:hypothetical protein